MKPQGSPAEDDTLSADDSSRFRALAARANYLAQYIPDIHDATKRALQRNEQPHGESMEWTEETGEIFS